MAAAPEEKLELQRELFRIAPREVAVGTTDYCAQTYGGPPDESERERGVTREEELHEWTGGSY